MSDTRHLTSLARIALVVAACDLASKAMAKELWSEHATWLSSWLHFAVIHNDKGAFGWTAGAYTWQLNLALTLSAITLMVPVARDLARIDSQAPRALGLIVGGALGNLASLVTSPYGVVDFIQIDLERVGVALNVADVAAYAGLAMIVRTGGLVVVALRQEARLREPSRATAVRSVFAQKARLADALRVAPVGVVARLADGDVGVIDFNRVVSGPVTLADAPPGRAPLTGRADGIVPPASELPPRRRRRGVVGAITPLRSMGAPHETDTPSLPIIRERD